MEIFTELLPNQLPAKPTTTVPTELVITDPRLRLNLLSQIVTK
jgi:hypothetical protein